MKTTIQVGDRVQWQHRAADDSRRYAGKLLTGKVRSIKDACGEHYAVVATDPDGRITMPSLDKLVKVEAVEPGKARGDP